MIQQSLYTLSAGSATQVAAPTVDTGHYLLKNIQPAADLGGYSRDGYTYSVSRSLTLSNVGTKDSSYVLRGGEEILFKLFPGEAINATAGHDGAKLTVIRQD